MVGVGLEILGTVAVLSRGNIGSITIPVGDICNAILVFDPVVNLESGALACGPGLVTGPAEVADCMVGVLVIST